MASPTLPAESDRPSGSTSFGDAICFKDVSIAFEGKPVLDGISFRLAQGEAKAIFGVAGSGKSTLAQTRSGLIKPDAGHISVLGQEIAHMREEDLFEVRRREGMVFQESALFDSLLPCAIMSPFASRRNTTFPTRNRGPSEGSAPLRRARAYARQVSV